MILVCKEETVNGKLFYHFIPHPHQISGGWIRPIIR